MKLHVVLLLAQGPRECVEFSCFGWCKGGVRQHYAVRESPEDETLEERTHHRRAFTAARACGAVSVGLPSRALSRFMMLKRTLKFT